MYEITTKYLSELFVKLLRSDVLRETLDEQIVVLVHVSSLGGSDFFHVWESSAWLAIDFEILHGVSNFLEFFRVIDSHHSSIEWFVHVSLDLWLILDFVLGEVLDLLCNGD